MWLLNVMDLSLKQVAEKDLEPQQNGASPRYQYGILSHRWEEDEEEASFAELSSCQSSRSSKGIRKIEECCRLAHSEGLDLLWADTCCIDKRSSAELQEAINSMYRYYERAKICFTYLRDVEIDTFEVDFPNSEWFTRGWTLQELLAPTDLRFYDRDWKYVGNKNTLAASISRITGIPGQLLRRETRRRDYSAAQKMSWAAERQTSRVEDRAYSLLGIFNVNLTMLYGEGNKSFQRLQEEIIKTWDDTTLFAWTGLQRGRPGLLAASPDSFVSSSNVTNIRARNPGAPCVFSNRGLRGTFHMIPYTLDTYLTLLSCTSSSTGNNRMGIFLRRLYEDDQFLRVSVCGEEWITDADGWLACRDGWKASAFERAINIRQKPLESIEVYPERIQGFRINEALLILDSNRMPLFNIEGEWDAENRILSLSPGQGNLHVLGIIDIGLQEREIEIIRLGFDIEYNPVVYLTTRQVQHRIDEESDDDALIERFAPQVEPDEKESFFDAERFHSNQPGDTYTFKYSRGARLPSRPELHGAQPTDRVDGLWALKADRLNGLDVLLLRGEEKFGHVRLSRTVVQEKVVWDLQIDELRAREDAIDEHGESIRELQFDEMGLTDATELYQN